MALPSPIFGPNCRVAECSEEELPSRLKEKAELAFHLAEALRSMNGFPSLSQKKRTPTRATRAGESSPAATRGDIEEVRAGLLAKSTSKALKVKLS